MKNEFRKTSLDKIETIFILIVLSIWFLLFWILPIILSINKLLSRLYEWTFNDSWYDFEFIYLIILWMVISYVFTIGFLHYFKRLYNKNEVKIIVDESFIFLSGTREDDHIKIEDIKGIQLINYYISNKSSQPLLYSKYWKTAVESWVEIIITLKNNNIEIIDTRIFGFSKRQTYGFYKFIKNTYSTSIEFKDPTFLAIEKA